MSNMSVENLQKIIQGGNTEDLFSGGAASEFRATQEMEESGDASSVDAGAGCDARHELLRCSAQLRRQGQYDANPGRRIHREPRRRQNENISAETDLAIERADSSLKLMMQVRTRFWMLIKKSCACKSSSIWISIWIWN